MPQKIKRVLSWLVLVMIIGAVSYYLSLSPSNDRVWSIDQERLAYAEFNTDEVTIFNIRNFSYASTTEYSPAYYDQTFNLDEVQTVDYIVEPFGNMGAAHTFLSFGFADDRYLAISVEIRKEVGETFSPLKGLLRQYEIMYVIADERDVINLRANHRKNPVYLYPTTATPEQAKAILISMLTRANELKDQPEFYNTFNNTCTTNIVDHVNEISPNPIGFSWKLLLPEYSDVLAHERGFIDNSLPLEALRTEHQINIPAEQYKDDSYFSKLIRE